MKIKEFVLEIYRALRFQPDNMRKNPLQHRIFILIVLSNFFSGVAISILLCFFSYGPFDLVISLAITLTSLGVLIISIKHQKDNYLSIPLVIVGSLTIIYCWFFYGGLNGFTPVLVVSSLVGARLLLVGKLGNRVFSFLFILLFISILIDINVPGFIQPFETDANTKMLHGFTLIIITSILTGLIQIVISEYSHQRDQNFILYQQTLKDKVRLEIAHSELDIMKGILPICAFCKKIRDSQGEWQGMEHYISLRSNVEFSHGFCPDCGDKHYSESNSQESDT